MKYCPKCGKLMVLVQRGNHVHWHCRGCGHWTLAEARSIEEASNAFKEFQMGHCLDDGIVGERRLCMDENQKINEAIEYAEWMLNDAMYSIEEVRRKILDIIGYLTTLKIT